MRKGWISLSSKHLQTSDIIEDFMPACSFLVSIRGKVSERRCQQAKLWSVTTSRAAVFCDYCDYFDRGCFCFWSPASLHHSGLYSTCSLLPLQITVTSANIRVRGELLSDLICRHVHLICKQDSELILDGILLQRHGSLPSCHVPNHPLIFFLLLPTSSYDITVPLFTPYLMLSLDPQRHGATLSFHQHCQSENATCRTSFQILSLRAIFPFLSVQPFIQLTISLFLFPCSAALCSKTLSTPGYFHHYQGSPAFSSPISSPPVFSHSTSKSPCRLFSVQRIYQTPSWQFTFPL